MTDYYPLISRAVTGLEKNTGESRRGLYERARTALVAQLRGLNPPLTESEITRERLALEEAIRKVEAESSRRVTRIEAPPRQKSAEAGRRDESPRPASAAAPLPRREAASGGQAAAAQARPISAEPAPPRAAARVRFNERSQLTDEGLKGFRDVVAEAETLGDATAQAGKTARQVFAAVPTSTPELDRLEPRIEPPGLRGPPPREQPALRPVEPRPVEFRSAEPRQTEDRPAEPRPVEARPAEPRPAEPSRALEAPPSRVAEPLPRPADPPPRAAEARQAQQRHARPFPTRHVAALDEDEERRPRRSAKGVIAAALTVFVLVALGIAVYWQREPMKNFFSAMRGQVSQNASRGIPPPTQPKNTDRVGQPSTSNSQAPGSPYTITSPANLVVLSQ